MKINRDKVAHLSALGDSELWNEIRSIAGSHGFRLPESTPSAADMAKLREAISGSARANLADAIRIINNYKRGAK